MPFNSVAYVLFVAAVYLVYLFAGDRVRWCLLLAASLLFYATLRVPYLLVVLGWAVLQTYLFAIWQDRARTAKAKSSLLACGISANLLVLVAMRYLPFLAENLNRILGFLSISAQVHPAKPLVAIGVSYFIFQAISYLIDVYLEVEKPERHIGYFTLYLSFFPKLLQGPIERASDLIPQLKKGYQFDYDNVRSGILLFAWGLFKKVVIADRLALYVDHVYGNVHAFAGLPLLMATYCYAFQIFLDFSGYTDMALGVARLFNINLTQNFKDPYLATSIADFWRRWHITFSRWILDYIFKPLQMRWRNRKDLGTAAAILVTFLASGLWHGASWGFIAWGGLHGVYLACSVVYKPYQKRLHKALGLENSRLLKVLQIVITFNLVCFTWIFFRAQQLGDSLYVVRNIFSLGGQITSFRAVKIGAAPFFAVDWTEFAILSGGFLFILAVNKIFGRISSPEPAQPTLLLQSTARRWFVYYAIGFSVAFFGFYKSTSSFIYLQF